MTSCDCGREQAKALKDVRHVDLTELKAGRAQPLTDCNVYIQTNGYLWRPKRCGYTDCLKEAGVYTWKEAIDASGHCGPEKAAIYFEALPLPVSTEGELKARVEAAEADRTEARYQAQTQADLAAAYQPRRHGSVSGNGRS